MRTNEGNNQTPLDEILSAATCIRLTAEAGRLYRALWSTWQYRNALKIALSDEAISKTARLAVWNLKQAQDELINEGLILISPSGDRTLYNFCGE